MTGKSIFDASLNLMLLSHEEHNTPFEVVEKIEYTFFSLLSFEDLQPSERVLQVIPTKLQVIGLPFST